MWRRTTFIGCRCRARTQENVAEESVVERARPLLPRENDAGEGAQRLGGTLHLGERDQRGHPQLDLIVDVRVVHASLREKERVARKGRRMGRAASVHWGEKRRQQGLPDTFYLRGEHRSKTNGSPAPSYWVSSSSASSRERPRTRSSRQETRATRGPRRGARRCCASTGAHPAFSAYPAPPPPRKERKGICRRCVVESAPAVAAFESPRPEDPSELKQECARDALAALRALETRTKSFSASTTSWLVFGPRMSSSCLRPSLIWGSRFASARAVRPLFPVFLNGMLAFFLGWFGGLREGLKWTNSGVILGWR